MLEYIFTGLALEADQIEPLHRRQPRLDTGLADRGGQQFRIETPSDHRRHLQECAVPCREAVDARGEQALHARRQRRCHRPDVEVQFAFRRADDAALRKKAHDFFGEQRIAFGLPRHLPSHRLGQALHPEPRLHQAANVADRQRLELYLGHCRAADPRRRVFRPTGGYEQEPQLGLAVDDLVQNFLGHAVDPVQILDGHDHGRELAACLQPLLQELARAQADQYAVEPGQRSVGDFQAKQMEQQADVSRRMQAERAQPDLQLPRHFVFGFAGAEPKRSAHDFNKREERRVLAVRRAASGQHDSAVGADAAAKLVDEAGLANAGFASDIDDAEPAAGVGVSALQGLQFAFASDEGTKAPAQRRLKPRGAMTNAVEPIDLLRLRFAFDAVFAGEAGLDHSLGQAMGGIAHDGRVRLGQRLQTRREIHGVAKDRDAGVNVLFHPAHHRRPGIKADPQLRAHPMFAFKFAARVSQPFQHRKRRAARPQRRVLERDRRTEHGHDAIAGKTLDDAAVLVHGIFHQLGEAAHQRKGPFLSRLLGKSREAHHVCEQDGDLPAFRFHAVLRKLPSANVPCGRSAQAKSGPSSRHRLWHKSDRKQDQRLGRRRGEVSRNKKMNAAIGSI